MDINENAKAVIMHDLESRVKSETESIVFTEEKLARKNEEIDRTKAELARMMAERDDLEKEINISRENIGDFKQALEVLKGENDEK